MGVVESFKNAKTLTDLAKLLGYSPSGLSSILYHITEADKYTSFLIAKRRGGLRTISALTAQLKFLQGRLASLLYEYLNEIEEKKKPFKVVVHGFAKSQSIITNGQIHKRRRYVLNLDLKDFFETINFGRVRGVFIKNRRFEFDKNVATRLAQIVCHNNCLPQGSPCSPVVSNIVGRLLDVRLVRLAKMYKCTYTRYADDITISTNQSDFPIDLACAHPGVPGTWVLGPAIISEIANCGFQININKTRMQFRNSRQLVTGLIVNKKVNIRSEYYRSARSMCNSLFTTGKYYRVVPAPLAGGKFGDPDQKVECTDSANLEGILSHIYLVKNTVDRRSNLEKKKEETAKATRKLYHRFLFYKNFVALPMPLIITEGKTDPIYLKAAIERLPLFHPKLGKLDNGTLRSAVRFMKFTRTVHDVLQLGGGSSDLKHFILKYERNLAKYKNLPLQHPVIILIDNDDGASDIFSYIKGNTIHKDISTQKSELFYKIKANLYLVKTPETGSNKGMTCIENFFEDSVLNTVLDGKTFDIKKKHLAPGKYGKQVLAAKVVRPNKNTINFSGFEKILSRVVAVMDDYSGK